VLETRTQAVTATELYGKTMVGYLESLGVLSEHVTMAHAIWMTDADLDVLVDAGVSLSWHAMCRSTDTAGKANAG
jgi:5-methylthioadenosine/S-adenosylhomocysteine deaminase